MSNSNSESKNSQGAEISQAVLWTYLGVAAVVIIALLCGLIAGGVLLKNARTAKDISVSFQSYEPWPEEIRDTFRSGLIHENGRVKPIHSYARFLLMSLSGRSSMKFETADGEKHSTEEVGWLLDMLFRGGLAREMPTFVVDDSAVVIAIGVSPKTKRDRYSYDDLLPGRAKLAELGEEYRKKQADYQASEKDPKYELTREEGMILRLASSMSAYEYLLGHLAFARKGQNMPNSDFWPDELKAIAEKTNAIEMLETMPELSAAPGSHGFDPETMDRNQWRSQVLSRLGMEIQRLRQNPQPSEDDRLYEGAISLMFFYSSSGQNFSIFPSPKGEGKEWLSAGDFLIAGLGSKEARPGAVARLKEIESLVTGQEEMFAGIRAARESGGSEEEIAAAVQSSVEPFSAALAKMLASARELAEARGEGAKAAKEVSFYERGYFSWSLKYFVFAFVLLAFSWLAPGSKVSRWLVRISTALVVFGLISATIGIWDRSIIRSRPPITNLYDTVIFIAAVAVLVSLLMEWINRRGVGLLAAVVCGMGGMFLSIRYEAKEGTDTMDPLVAVLDTNFWLATHVTAINIGYAAGMLAAILSIFYLVGRFFQPMRRVIGAMKGGKSIQPGNVFRAPKEERELFRTISRMVYGVICFCLFFALVGTVLGGIWANYSWGRFWGWDPKENGALMICLWTLVILHARMGGYVREIGVNVASVLLGVIVTFSWWGVNNLGVGLHSYGFTEGVWPALYVSWTAAAVVVLCGFPLWLADRLKSKGKTSAPASDEESSETAPPPPLPETA